MEVNIIQLLQYIIHYENSNRKKKNYTTLHHYDTVLKYGIIIISYIIIFTILIG